MIVVGENLKQLIDQYHMVDRPNCFDETCIQLSLGPSCIQMLPPDPESPPELVYGEPIPESVLHKFQIGADGLVLQPHSAILAASVEIISMPMGYWGLLQTKGSLARLCVSLHFSDGQIDPGFRGPVTFEMFNASPFPIRIYKLQAVGNLYICKATTKRHKPYMGRYANAAGPTLQKPGQ